MKKSHVSSILAAAFAAVLLAGCGSSGSSIEAFGSKKTGSQSQTQDTGSQGGSGSRAERVLSGEITFWYSFTQGPRLETIQKAADKFVEENPDVKINIETFLWNNFYTKWTTGPTSGNVPDMSIVLPAQIAEMINADTPTPINDLINDIGRDKFAETAISEGTMDGNSYSVPPYKHTHMMWIGGDLLEKSSLGVPKAWDELYNTAKALAKGNVYGLSFPCRTNDFQAILFLDFYMRSGGGSLLTNNLETNLASDLAIGGINYQLKVYNDCSPKDSIDFNAPDRATLYHQDKTAPDFNSGLQVSGVAASPPDLPQYVDCYPTPKINVDDPDEGIMTTNTFMVVWKASKHPEICRASMKTLYDEDTYAEFLHATPVGTLPVIKGIIGTDAYRDDDTIRQFTHTEEASTAAADIDTAFGYEHGPNVQAGIMQNSYVIEDMSQSITTSRIDVGTAVRAAEDRLNALFEIAE